MTYDQWKTRDPNDRAYYDDYEEYEPDFERCDHDDYDADILTGRATCYRCGHSWYQTTEEINAAIERQREYSEWEERENRREFWRKLTLPVRWPIFRLLERVWPRKSLSVLTDDEIPF